MRNRYSLAACMAILAVMLTFRIARSPAGGGKPIKITDWDALGYYMYLPATFIYHDIRKYDWMAPIDRQYAVTGSGFYQVQDAGNGNQVCKYLGGVAIMQAPLFFLAHFIARYSSYPADGFSAPYQTTLAYGALLYAFLALLVLRKVLLRYFRDGVTAVTLCLVCLATNYIEYGALETGQSHAYIFCLYAAVLYSTLKWHERPAPGWALLTGYIIGLATISRPTEAIMLFIPLLWGMHNKAASREKWRLVAAHKAHVGIIIGGALLGILPQLIYWKAVTGSFIYDVGSKWVFFNPYFRVLFGWEKGWFIYTPATLLFVAGLAFVKRYPFRRAVLTFCLLNIWIIIAWDDWRYGGSYSTRALVQSYPVFALATASLTERIMRTRWRPLFYLAGAYLLAVNIFQTVQYAQGIIHYNDMNRRYYSRIYLNPHPSPIDMSVLDSNEVLSSSWAGGPSYTGLKTAGIDTILPVNFKGGGEQVLLDNVPVRSAWIEIAAVIQAPDCLWQSELYGELRSDTGLIKSSRVRLLQPVGERTHRYAFFMRVPPRADGHRLRIVLRSPNDFHGSVKQLQVTGWTLSRH